MNQEELAKRVGELFHMSQWYPDGVNVSEVNQLLNDARASGDPKLHFQASAAAVVPYSRIGQPDKAVVAFAQCLSNLDRVEPDSWLLLLLPYKSALARVQDLPQISWSDLQGMERDFLERLQQQGYNREPVLYVGWKLRMAMGQLDDAWAMYEQWREEPRSALSDCEACCENAAVRLLAHCEKDEEAVAKAEDILRRDLTCGSIPRETHAEVLVPLMRLKRKREAQRHHEKGMRLLEERMCIYTLAFHLVYLLHIGERDRTLSLLEEALPAAVETTSVENKLFNYRAAWLLFELQASDGEAQQTVDLPSSLGCHSTAGRYDTCELTAWFREACLDMQDQYDTRNGNQYYTERTNECQLVGLLPC